MRGSLRMLLCAALLLFGEEFLYAGPAQTNTPTATPPTNSPAPTNFVTLAWNPSPDTNVIGYFLCWGVTSGVLTNRMDVGNATIGTLGGLQTNVTYYLTVIGYDGTGRESLPSNEVAYSVPVTPPVTPTLSLGPQSTDNTNAAFCLSFQGSSGSTYQIQASQDLQTWDTLWTTNCAADGAIVFEITDMANYPWRFYRLMQQSN
jgi:hypothetical protein